MTLEYPLGNGRVMFWPESSILAFLLDDSIDHGGNEVAALRLLQRMLDR